MFKKYPYRGWLIVSLLLWSGVYYYFHLHRQAMLPERMAEAVYKDLRQREDKYEGYLLEHDWIRKMFADSLSDKERERIDGFPFFMFGFEGDSLKFWNTNIYVASNSDSVYDKPIIINNEKGLFIEKIHQLPFLTGNKKLMTLFPVIIYYPIENDYLKSYFVASKYIPLRTVVVPVNQGTKSDFLVKMRGNVSTFYLRFNPTEIQKWVPDEWFIVMLIAAILAAATWLNLATIHLNKNRNSWRGFLITLSVITVLRSYLFIFGLPFNLDTLDLFSPQLYASSRWLSSLGDLFIDTLFELWIVVFLARYTPYKTYFDKLHSPKKRFAVAIALMATIIGYVFLFVGIIRSLVLDSNISFDVSHFYTINFYTIFGLFVIGAIAGVSCIVIYLFNIQFNALLPKLINKYILIVTTGIFLLLITGNITDPFSWILIGWYVVFTAFIDHPNFALVSDILKPHMIYWAVFICAFCTGILQYFNETKEHETRKAFVLQHLSPRRDDVMEYSFDNTAKTIEEDKLLKSFLDKPTSTFRRSINQHFDDHYFTGPLHKYQAKLYLFDNLGRPLFNRDSTTYRLLEDERKESVSTASSFLFYKQSILDRHYYLSYIPIYNDSTYNLLGYVIIDLDMKKRVAETVYPELMQPIAGRSAVADNDYAYAVYINDKLVSQTNIYPFLVKLDNDTLPVQHYSFYRRDNILELAYKVSDKRTIVVMHYHSLAIELMTIFSYLFIALVFLAVFILAYQYYLSRFNQHAGERTFKKLTIQKRLHYAMLGIVFFSFLVIGVVTGVYFSSESEVANNNKLQVATQVARQSVQDFLKHAHAFDGDIQFDSVGKSTAFKSFLTGLANNQKVDINIFDSRGNLFSTSQEEIYDKGLISRKMRPEAYHKLHTEGTSIVIQNEKVGDLPYISLYEPLRNEHGATLGYINVPFFSSKKELNYQIYNIIVTFVYIYAFIFLVSGLVTVSIAQWITKSFNIIIRQFDRINLKLNERIEWPYDDEIGLLVTKYNEMVKKVELNAAIMAQTEREMAWREMAKQIAHEIKNPLTPMKLNIQYLQQTIKNNDAPAKIKELTDRVTESIVEQIENLAYIASEFSDFAKMPDAREEEIELNDFLGKTIELYLNDENIVVTFNKLPDNVYVLCDRSQLLRVFNNLLENARQAIPADRRGFITVTLSLLDHTVQIAVKDNGTGIDKSVEARIFQPYFTTKSSGTGLGLAMTKKILEFWRGHIGYETETGLGTTFYVTLPVR